MLLLSSTAAADASSFVAIAPPKQPVSRSFVVLGTPGQPVTEAEAEPDAGAETRDALASLPMPADPDTPPMRRISRSILAVGSPGVTFEQVAAVRPTRPARNAMQTAPLVIRGGIVGDLPIATPPALATRAKPQAVSVKGKAQGTATPGPKRAAEPTSRRPDPPAPALPDQPAPPPPPPPSMPMLRGQD